jgi:hypothetical protein
LQRRSCCWSYASRCVGPPPPKLSLTVSALALAITVVVRAAPGLANSDPDSPGPPPTTQGGGHFIDPVDGQFGLHAGLDFAHSPGTNAVYIQVGNSWFRP